jgi:hypothetical protein
MKKILLIASFLLVFVLTASVASAHGSFHFRFFLPPVVIGPPVISAPPPAYYPDPNGYYGPGYYGYRAWVPGYWGTEWTGHGWVRVWHPGHWEYRP